MRNALLLSTILLLAECAGCSRNIDLAPALESLVQTERDFAKTSVEKGNRQAFLDFCAANAVLFRPYPTPAQPYLLAEQDDESILTWEPSFADIARSGDMGYTTGPWEYRAHAGDTLAIHGHYVTVWKKQSDGEWRFVIDVGTSNPAPAAPPPALQTPFDGMPSVVNRFQAADRETERAALLARDHAFAVMTQEKGADEAFFTFANEAIRVYRRGSPPFVGKQHLTEALGGMMTGTLSWDPADADVSLAGDLGYTYGIATLAENSGLAGSVRYLTYMRIWKKLNTGIWMVVVDVMNPAPPPTKPTE
jgi:ketosteroid isomerase-like protein